MGRKERCLQCGSKKITMTGNLKKCEVCKYEWAGKRLVGNNRDVDPRFDKQVDAELLSGHI